MGEAFKVFVEMVDRDFVFDVVMYNLLINWLFKKRYKREAQFLLSDMRKGVLISITSPIELVWEEMTVQESVGCYNQIKEETFVRNIVPCNSLIFVSDEK